MLPVLMFCSVEHIQLVVRDQWHLCDLKAIGLKLAMLKQFERDQGRLKAITGTIGKGTAYSKTVMKMSSEHGLFIFVCLVLQIDDILALSKRPTLQLVRFRSD